MYNEAEQCDLQFALNTFKMGLPKDKNGIYNAHTRQPPATFDELLTRVNEYARVEDDDMAEQEAAPGNAKVNNVGAGGSSEKFYKSKWAPTVIKVLIPFSINTFTKSCSIFKTSPSLNGRGKWMGTRIPETRNYDARTIRITITGPKIVKA